MNYSPTIKMNSNYEEIIKPDVIMQKTQPIAKCEQKAEMNVIVSIPRGAYFRISQVHLQCHFYSSRCLSLKNTHFLHTKKYSRWQTLNDFFGHNIFKWNIISTFVCKHAHFHWESVLSLSLEKLHCTINDPLKLCVHVPWLQSYTPCFQFNFFPSYDLCRKSQATISEEIQNSSKSVSLS